MGLPTLANSHNRGFNLLPPKGIKLVKNNFDEDGKPCTSDDVFQATFSSFALPTNSTDYSIVAYFGDLDLEDFNGVVFVLDGVTLRFNPVAGMIVGCRNSQLSPYGCIGSMKC